MHDDENLPIIPQNHVVGLQGQPATIDPALDSKAMQLETEIRQQNTSIKSVLESLKHMESSQLPSMANTLQNLRTAIERIVVADIPNSVKPVEDDVTRVRQKFDKFTGDANNKLQFLNERLNDASSSISQVLSRYTDLSSVARTSVAEIDTELSRQRDTLDNAASRLTGLESGMAQADDILKSLRIEIQNLSRTFSDRLSQFQGETISSFGMTTSSLGSALKNESKVRQETMTQIQKQINDVNRQTTEVISKMQIFLKNTKNQYQTALVNLSKAAKDGLTACSQSASDGFSQIDSRINQFVMDSNTQFASLESDVSSTIQALKNHIITARDGLESVLSSLSQQRVNSEQEVISKYDELKLNLTTQLKNQTDNMENMCNTTVNNIIGELEQIVGTIKAQLADVKGQIERVQRLEQRVEAITTNAEQTRTQLVDQMNQLGQKYNELLVDVEKLQGDFNDKSNDLEQKIAFFENPENRPNYATKKELNEVIQRTQMMFEGRLEEIEQQIGHIFAHISELTLKGIQKPRVDAESGASAISKLVQDQLKE